MWGKRLKISRDEVRKLYKSGLSSRQIGEIVGCSGRHVWKTCGDIARDRYEAAKLRQPPTKFYPRACRQAARNLMARTLGRKLERHEVVHHINGDPTDNRLENLKLMTRREHGQHHAYERWGYDPTPRHLRPKVRAYMKEYLKKYHRRKKDAAGQEK